MALTNFKAGNYLSGPVVKGSYPALIACMAWSDTDATSGDAVSQGGSSHQRMRLRHDAGDARLVKATTRGSASPFATSTTQWSVDQWHLWVGAFLDDTVREAYLDGGGRGEGSDQLATNAPTSTHIGQRNDGTNPFGAGRAIGWVQLWDISGFSQADREALVARLGTTTGGLYPDPRAVNDDDSEPWTGRLMTLIRAKDRDDLDDLVGANNFTIVEDGGDPLTVFAAEDPPVDDIDDVEPPTPLEVTRHRWRNDDGDEAEATWREAEDTPTTVEVGETVRLRTQIQATGDVGETSMELRFRKKGTADPWEPVQ